MSLIKAFGSMKLVDKSTGKEICEIQDFNDFHQPNITSEISINQFPEFRISFDDTYISPELAQVLYNSNPLEQKYGVKLKGTKTVFVQARKHGQKRINKKWLKRYGYKEVGVSVEYSLKDCSITQNEYDSNSYCIEGKL